MTRCEAAAGQVGKVLPMIAKIGQGQNVSELVSYLFDPAGMKHVGQQIWDLDVIARS